MMSIKSQAGVSLIEMMIAMVIGLLLVAGVATLFTGNNQTYQYNQTQILQAENLRIASRVISGILPQAGHTNINTASIQGKKTAFVDDSTASNYAGHKFTNLAFSAGQVIVGNATADTAKVEVDVYSRAGNSTEKYSQDKISIRYLAGYGIMTCEGHPYTEDVVYLTDTENDYLLQQRVESIYIDDDLNLVCDATNLTIDASAATTVNRGAVTNTILIGDANASRADQVRVLGLEIQYGLDTDDDNSIDSYSRDPDDWLQVLSATIDITIQTGFRPPQTMTHVVAFQNIISANTGV